MLKMFITSLHVLSLSIFLKLKTALFCGKISRVFPSVTFHSETVLGFERSFQESFDDMIFPGSSNLES